MKRWLAPILVLLVLGILIGWRLQSKRADAKAQVQMRQARTKSPVSVVTAPAVVRDIVSTFEGVGTVESPLNVRIAAKTSGRVLSIAVREGDPVQPGQVIARIDDAEEAAAVRQQQAVLAEARFRLAQARLNQDPTNATVLADVRKQRATVTSARADLRQVRENSRSAVAAAEASALDVQGRVTSAEAAVENARAMVRSAQANHANAKAREARIADLHRQKYVAAQDLDDARTAVAVQDGALDVARGQVAQAQALLGSARAQKVVADRQVEIAREKASADLEAAQARLSQAEASLTVAEANRAQRPAFRENLAALSAGVDAAGASLRSAQARLADCALTSSIAGSVTARGADPGAMATPGQMLLVVQSLRDLWVTVPVPEEIVRKMRLGMAGTVRLDALPGREIAGVITQVNPAADAASRQFAVRITLPNPRAEIKPGMFGRATFEVERVRGVVVVPREAVSRGRGGATVTVVDAKGGTERRKVKTGASDPLGIAIESGVRPGDKVVVLSAAPLREGAKVRTGAPGGGKGKREGGARGGAAQGAAR